MNICKKINSIIQNAPSQVWEGMIVVGATALSGYLAGIPSVLATLTTYLAGRNYVMPSLGATHQADDENQQEQRRAEAADIFKRCAERCAELKSDLGQRRAFLEAFDPEFDT